MTTAPTPDQLADAERTTHILAAELRDPLMVGLTQLAELLRRPTPMIALPSDRWIGTTTSVPSDRSLNVAGASPARLRVTLVNVGTSDLALGPDDAGLTADTGFPLPVGASVTIPTAAAVYAIAETSGGRLGVIVEDRT